MLICDKAYIKPGQKPAKIFCKAQDGGLCAHVRYCGISMKYYQTDAAKKCLLLEGDHEETE